MGAVGGELVDAWRVRANPTIFALGQSAPTAELGVIPPQPFGEPSASMISPEQIAIFARFHGDADGFERLASAADREVMSAAVWHRLDELLMQLGQLQAGVVAPEYATRIRVALATEVPDPAAQAILYRLAGARS